MERIRTYIAGVLVETHGRIEYELLQKGEEYWSKTLGQKSGCDRDILNTIINEEVAKYYGGEVTKSELPDLSAELKIAEADGKVTAEELLAMNRTALREYADKMGISTTAFTKKADIIAAINKG